MIRAFLAVELPEDLRNALGRIQHDLKQRLDRGPAKNVRVSWVPPAALHLTVKFLGDTDEQVIDALREAVTPLVARYLPITLPLERLGVFPRLHQPRVLWVGPSAEWEQGAEAGRLVELHRMVEDGCRPFGFAPEGRPWSPHLTLARIKEGERQIGQALVESGVLDRPVTLGSLRIASIVLMKSELRPTGALYTRLWQV